MQVPVPGHFADRSPIQPGDAVMGVFCRQAGTAVAAHTQSQDPFLPQAFLQLHFHWCDFCGTFRVEADKNGIVKTTDHQPLLCFEQVALAIEFAR